MNERSISQQYIVVVERCAEMWCADLDEAPAADEEYSELARSKRVASTTFTMIMLAMCSSKGVFCSSPCNGLPELGQLPDRGYRIEL